jgi:hypothetical protein
VISDEREALQYAMQNAVKGSFIVCCSDKIQKSIEFISAQQQQKEYAEASEF